MTWEVKVGDCLEVMPTLEENSVDAIVSDPPYGLSFMGKSWDHGVPGEPFWREALRVAKPGAHLLAFGGTRTFHRLTRAIEDAGWEIRDCLSWLYGSGFPKSLNIGEGRGTALKPAWEPIILARKPLIGTVAANVQEHSTGALNIDGCRIEGVKGVPASLSDAGGLGWRTGGDMARKSEQNGRWPANVALDEEAAQLLDEQSGELISGANPTTRAGLGYHGGNGQEIAFAPRGLDVGGASRFFYTAKASRSEREEGLTRDFTLKKGGIKNDSGRGFTETAPYADIRVRNHHPTVKPVDLMAWLCRLVTPPNGLILDPFCGSGSTGCGAVYEGFRFIGIEKEQEYAEIARARIAHWELAHQPSLFDGDAA